MRDGQGWNGDREGDVTVMEMVGSKDRKNHFMFISKIVKTVLDFYLFFILLKNST
jgi:hypothetical protein